MPAKQYPYPTQINDSVYRLPKYVPIRYQIIAIAKNLKGGKKHTQVARGTTWVHLNPFITQALSSALLLGRPSIDYSQ